MPRQPQNTTGTGAGPTRECERRLLENYTCVAGMDEVGRGALAGPVTVGVAVVTPQTSDAFPQGLQDSKKLSPARRQALCEPVRQWAADAAVGHASAAEIDRYGIMAALRLAARRALAELAERGHAPQAVILDGNVNWLHEPQRDLLTMLDADADTPEDPFPAAETCPVILEIKGDARCAVVAAASNLAKVERDGMMEAMEDQRYQWARNKGYASPAHIAALQEYGPSDAHRRSWQLPGVN